MRSAFSRLRCSRALVLGMLSVALVLMSGMIQAAHFHTPDSTDHDCALCLAVHSTAQTTAPIELHFTSRPVARLVALRTIARPRPAVHFRLSSRPPPAPPTLFI